MAKMVILIFIKFFKNFIFFIIYTNELKNQFYSKSKSQSIEEISQKQQKKEIDFVKLEKIKQKNSPKNH